MKFVVPRISIPLMVVLYLSTIKVSSMLAVTIGRVFRNLGENNNQILSQFFVVFGRSLENWQLFRKISFDTRIPHRTFTVHCSLTEKTWMVRGPSWTNNLDRFVKSHRNWSCSPKERAIKVANCYPSKRVHSMWPSPADVPFNRSLCRDMISWIRSEKDLEKVIAYIIASVLKNGFPS